MKCGKRCQSAISIAVTGAALCVLVLWIASHSFSLALGMHRVRGRPTEAEWTFVGLHSYAGQVGFGRSYKHRKWDSPVTQRQRHPITQPATRPAAPIATAPATLPAAVPDAPWVGEWEVTWEAGLRERTLWLEWTGNSAEDSPLTRMGFEALNIHLPGAIETVRERAILVPWWAVFLVTCTVAVKWLFFRERRIYWGKVGRCAACGYDLRQSSERCPECGEQIPNGAAAPSKAVELR